MPQNRISDFFLDLAQRPQRLEEFHSDPLKVGRQANLPRDVLDAIQTKDAFRIQQAVLANGVRLPANAAEGDGINVTIVVVLVP